MPAYRAKVGREAQVALPLELVEKLGIREGEEVEFFQTLNGDVYFHAINARAVDWKGLFPGEVRRPPLSIREMDAAMAEEIAEDDERIRRQASEVLHASIRDRSAAE
jgi:bifunctional DNA-binding transcriptional regulator/antitoxin component of YhaV-PrlF toxin-antitoxin module